MSASRILIGSIVLGMVASGPARADALVSMRPGVACTSADALARLTRPDGSSRSTPTNATADAREIARRGGCFPFGPGLTVFPHSIRRQTSIVTAYAADRLGPLTVYVANIDFERVAVPGSRGAALVESQPAPITQGTAAALSVDRPAAEAGPDGTHRSLSTGLLSLGMTTRDARRRFAGSYVVFDLAGSGDGRDAGFIAETRDQSERYEVRSRAGTVFLVMHAVRFARGHQQVLSALVDRLLAQYGTGPTLVTLPGTTAGAAAPSIPPQPAWRRDWIGHPVVMAPRDSLEDATRSAGDLTRCAQQMALLDPSDTGDRPTGGRQPAVSGEPSPDAPSCGKEVLVRLEPGTTPSVVGRLLVILADQPGEPVIEPDAAPADPSVR